MSDPTGQTLAGYEIVSKLGQGGMGAVYKARQPLLNRFAALKTLPGELARDPDYVRRFQREAAAAGNLNHPNIVQVYAAGESGGTHFIAMEFVEGETLRERLERQGRIEPDEALAITVYVAEALKHGWNKAHIIHRDIKPDNIFLSSTGEVKVGDLGLAKSVGGETTAGLTQTGVAIGTPHYLAPEQGRGDKNIDCRADIYSLGCTLFHMLTGRTPYEGDSAMAVVHKQIHDPPPGILKVWPQCPMPLVMLVGKMLKKHPNERHQNYDELINDILRLPDKLRQPAPQQPARSALPTGVVTMMFTDILDSTRLKAQMAGVTAMERDGAYTQTVKQPHDRIVRECAEKAGGHVVKSTGDGFFLAFSDAEAAVLCALSIQQQLVGQPIMTPLGPLQVRIGLHTGSATATEGDYAVATADKAARVAAQASGGQVLISRQTHVLVEQLRGVAFRQTGPFQLKGIEGAEHFYAVSFQAVKSGTPRAVTPRVASGAAAAPKKSPAMLCAAAAAAVFVLGGAVWWAPWKKPQENVGGASTPRPSDTPAQSRGAEAAPSVQKHAVDAAFLREVAALPAQEQVARVVAKLKELNPGYGGKKVHKIENGQVAELDIREATDFTDLSPVRALTHLRRLVCNGYKSPDGKQAILQLRDLSPLRGLPLEEVMFNSSALEDLSPLQGLPLSFLSVAGSSVQDLTPLRGMPLKKLMIHNTKIRDFSPLRDTPVEWLLCAPHIAAQPANRKVLEAIQTLQTINNLPAAEFWKRVDAGEAPQAN